VIVYSGSIYLYYCAYSVVQIDLSLLHGVVKIDLPLLHGAVKIDLSLLYSFVKIDLSLLYKHIVLSRPIYLDSVVFRRSIYLYFIVNSKISLRDSISAFLSAVVYHYFSFQFVHFSSCAAPLLFFLSVPPIISIMCVSRHLFAQNIG
jgi:hypothetical protein